MKDKIRSFLYSYRFVAILSVVLLVITTIPAVHVGMFNYATGDDLLYGSVVKRALAEGASFSDIFSRVFRDVVDEYYSFQGTWSSQLLWRFEPSIWNEKLYVVTIFIALFSIIGGTYYFVHTVMHRHMGYSVALCLIFSCWLLFYSIQYMPYPRGGLFWFTGMTHYTMPYGMVLVALAWALNYISYGNVWYLVGVALVFTYIGGSGYPSVVLAGVGLFFEIVWGVFKKGERRSRALRLLIPVLLLVIGFAVSALAPGNTNRGGEDYYFSLSRVFYVIGKCFVEGVSGIAGYFITIRPLFLLPVGLIIFSLGQKGDVEVSWKMIVIIAVVGVIIVCMVRSPEIFAGTTVKAGISGGVYDTYFYLSLLYVSILAVLLGTKLSDAVMIEKAEGLRALFIVFSLLFWIVLGKHLIGNALDYKCIDFIRSGQMADYEEQMQERFRLLASEEDVVVLPFINDEQGPLMHMPVTEDPDNYTNYVTAKFYGKQSVVGMDRNEWKEKYGDY